MNRSYHEMILLPTFIERFNYLQLYGTVGVDKLGEQRPAIQALYHTPEWKSVRDRVIIRDNACDLAHRDHEILSPPVHIHHINPITPEDALSRNPKIFDMDNLVVVSPDTHTALHFGRQEVRKMTMRERSQDDTCPWKRPGPMVTMIIGLPGSGKSTLAKQILRDGICYDLDAITDALKLTVTDHHSNSPARKVANAIQMNVIDEARKYARRIVVIRTAPSPKELRDVMPDKLIVCRHLYVTRNYEYDVDGYMQRINDAVMWAKTNGVQVEEC